MAVTLRPQTPAMLELQNLFSEQPRFLRTQEALSLIGDTQLKRHLWVTATVQSSKNKRVKELTEQAWHEEEIKKELVELKSQESAEKAQKSRDDNAEMLDIQQPPKVVPKPKPIKFEIYVQQLENRIRELEEEIKQTEIEVENLNEDAYIRLEGAKKEVNDALKQAEITGLRPGKIAFLDKVLTKIEANEKQGITDHSKVLAWFKTVGLGAAGTALPSSDSNSDKAEEDSEKKVVEELARKDSPLRKACKNMAECKDDLEKQYNKLAEEFYEKELLRRDLAKKMQDHPVQEWIGNALQPGKSRKQEENIDEDEEAYKSMRPSLGKR